MEQVNLTIGDIIETIKYDNYKLAYKYIQNELKERYWKARKEAQPTWNEWGWYCEDFMKSQEAQEAKFNIKILNPWTNDLGKMIEDVEMYIEKYCKQRKINITLDTKTNFYTYVKKWDCITEEDKAKTIFEAFIIGWIVDWMLLYVRYDWDKTSYSKNFIERIKGVRS